MKCVPRASQYANESFSSFAVKVERNHKLRGWRVDGCGCVWRSVRMNSDERTAGQDGSRRVNTWPSLVWRQTGAHVTRRPASAPARADTHISERRDEWRNDVKRLQPWRSPSTSSPPLPSSSIISSLPPSLVYCCVCPQAKLSRDGPLACEGESSESGSVL